MRDIGKNIRTIRQARNMTQDILAEKLFVTRQTVSNYETGRSRPDVDMLLRIAEVLQTDPNTVIYGIPVPEDQKKAWLRLCIASAITVLLGVALLILQPIGDDMLRTYYTTWLQVLVKGLGWPVFAGMLGWCAMDGVFLLLKSKELAAPWVTYVRRGLLGLTAVLALFSLPVIVFFLYAGYLSATRDSVSLSFPNIPVLSMLFHWSFLLSVKAPAVYTALCAGLRLLGFPRRKA